MYCTYYFKILGQVKIGERWNSMRTATEIHSWRWQPYTNTPSNEYVRLYLLHSTIKYTKYGSYICSIHTIVLYKQHVADSMLPTATWLPHHYFFHLLEWVNSQTESRAFQLSEERKHHTPNSYWENMCSSFHFKDNCFRSPNYLQSGRSRNVNKFVYFLVLRPSTTQRSVYVLFLTCCTRFSTGCYYSH